MRRPGSIRQDHIHRDRGAAAVEFALILPILIALLFGIVEFGLAFNTHISLTQAAREGVRVAALDTGDAEQATKDAFLGVIGAGGGDLQVTVTECPDTPDEDDDARVDALIDDYETILLNFGPFDLSGEAVMRCEA